MVLLGRLLNVFPIAGALNRFQKTKISAKNQVRALFVSLSHGAHPYESHSMQQQGRTA